MKKTNTLIITKICFFLVFYSLSGCSNDFDPVVDGTRNHLMMFSVLDNRLPSQYVYLQKSYQKNGENIILPGYEVFLEEESGNAYRLRDTLLGSNKFKIYYLPDYNIKRNSVYYLKAVKDSAIIQWSSVFVQPDPVDSVIAFYDPSLLDVSLGFDIFLNFENSFFNSKHEYIYKFQTFIEYEYDENGVKCTKLRQIPDKIRHPSIGSQSIWTFSKLEFDKIEYMDHYSTRYSQFKYLNGAVYWTLRFLDGDYSPSRYTIKKGFVVINIIDSETYNQLIASRWDDAISARFDSPPVYTNMMTNSGDGYGFFGSYLCDTVNFKIDQSLIEVFGYNNGQK